MTWSLTRYLTRYLTRRAAERATELRTTQSACRTPEEKTRTSAPGSR